MDVVPAVLGRTDFGVPAVLGRKDFGVDVPWMINVICLFPSEPLAPETVPPGEERRAVDTHSHDRRQTQ